MAATGRAARAQPALGVQEELRTGGYALAGSKSLDHPVAAAQVRAEHDLARLHAIGGEHENDRSRAGVYHRVFGDREAATERDFHFHGGERSRANAPVLVVDLEPHLERA